MSSASGAVTLILLGVGGYFGVHTLANKGTTELAQGCYAALEKEFSALIPEPNASATGVPSVIPRDFIAAAREKGLGRLKATCHCASQRVLIEEGKTRVALAAVGVLGRNDLVSLHDKEFAAILASCQKQSEQHK